MSHGRFWGRRTFGGLIVLIGFVAFGCQDLGTPTAIRNRISI